MSGLSRFLPNLLLAIVAVSVVLLALMLRGTTQALAAHYYATMCVLGWIVLRGNRGLRFAAALQSIPLPPLLRAVLLGYAAVVFEETLVGSFYALNQGFTPAIWVRAVRQFISFNLLAFTGAILGLTVALRLLPGLSRWHLLVAGVWGLFAERSYLIFLGNPLAGLIVAGPNVAVYSIILATIVLSMPDHDDAAGRGRAPWAPLVAWALMFALSLPAVLMLLHLRHSYPAAFPDCDSIACDP
ncbi:MAG: hypothetical protein ABI832_23030 [bacterium]